MTSIDEAVDARLAEAREQDEVANSNARATVRFVLEAEFVLADRCARRSRDAQAEAARLRAEAVSLRSP